MTELLQFKLNRPEVANLGHSVPVLSEARSKLTSADPEWETLARQIQLSQYLSAELRRGKTAEFHPTDNPDDWNIVFPGRRFEVIFTADRINSLLKVIYGPSLTSKDQPNYYHQYQRSADRDRGICEHALVLSHGFEFQGDAKVRTQLPDADKKLLRSKSWPKHLPIPTLEEKDAAKKASQVIHKLPLLTDGVVLPRQTDWWHAPIGNAVVSG